TSGTDTVTVEVDPASAASDAAFTYHKAYTVPQGLVDLTAALDSPPQDAQFFWDFGDNTAVRDGALASHAYTTSGTYTVTLTEKGYSGTYVFQKKVDVYAGPLARATPLGASQAAKSSPGVAPMLAFAVLALAAVA